MTISRYLLGALGVFLLYLAFFITGEEQAGNEEAKLANRLDKAWKRIRQAQSAAMSWQAAFCQTIAELFDSFLKSIFGNDLLSSRSVALAVILCALPQIVAFLFEPASLVFKVLLVYCIIGLWIKATDDPTLGVITSTVLLSLGPAFYRWWTQHGLSREFYSIRTLQDLLDTLTIALEGLVLPACAAILLGIIGLALFLLTNKVLLRRSSSGSPAMLVLVLVANAVLTALFLAPLLVPAILFALKAKNYPDPVMFALRNAQEQTFFSFAMRAATGFLAVISMFPALTGMLLMLLVILMLTHRIIWPVLWRPVYAMHYHKIFEQHKLLGALAALCMWKAWPNSVTEFLHSTLLKFP